MILPPAEDTWQADFLQEDTYESRQCQNLYKHILVFETPEAARKKLGKKKPMLWVVTEALTKQPDQPWRADKRTPVILLSNQPESEITIEKNTGKVIILPVPVLPETLRNAVKTYLLIKEGN